MLKGFDTSAYPGDATMTKLKQDFDFCGFYLAPAPSHQNVGWMNKLETLRRLKYMLLPIFVGQEVTGPGSKTNTKAQGVEDAKKACRLMTNAGFNHGSPIYLDLENGAPMTAQQHDYVEAWIAEVTTLGFTPGVYCSHTLTARVSTFKCLIWDFQVPTVSRTYQNVPVDAAQPIPAGLSARQYRQNIVLRGTGLLVDLDTAPNANGLAR